ncbi:MAG: hypothetical protein QXU09_03000 [Thermoproteota archaeon]
MIIIPVSLDKRVRRIWLLSGVGGCTEGLYGFHTRMKISGKHHQYAPK